MPLLQYKRRCWIGNCFHFGYRFQIHGTAYEKEHAVSQFTILKIHCSRAYPEEKKQSSNEATKTAGIVMFEYGFGSKNPCRRKYNTKNDNRGKSDMHCYPLLFVHKP